MSNSRGRCFRARRRTKNRKARQRAVAAAMMSFVKMPVPGLVPNPARAVAFLEKLDPRQRQVFDAQIARGITKMFGGRAPFRRGAARGA
jgi:hypothetical protein